MRLSLFRRRIDPADLPPVSGSSMPGPLHSGLTGSWPNAVMAGASVLAAAVASAEATHATKTTVEPPDDRVCAYRDPYTGQLACPPCYAEDVSVLWTPRTNDDLPRGGLCSFCDVDVLTFLDPEPAPVATSWPDREPQPIPGPIPGLAPLEYRPPLWVTGAYTVTYDRVGDYGRPGSGIPSIMPLICRAKAPGDLAQRIVEDVDMLIGLRVSAVVDQAAGGGHILGEGGTRIGSFTFELRKDPR